MQILERGREHRETLLFFPCTAEPVWAFADTIAVLSQRWHIFQVVFDGHQPEYPGDFTSVGRAIIDGGMTPYRLPFLVRKLLLARDVLSFRTVASNREVLEAAFPPERFTPPGHDSRKEYNAMERYLKTFSNRTIRNIFWSANNYALPKVPAECGTKITYWYGCDEKKDRRYNIRFIKHYFPQIRVHGIPKMAHAELVLVHPELFDHYAEKFLKPEE